MGGGLDDPIPDPSPGATEPPPWEPPGEPDRAPRPAGRGGRTPTREDAAFFRAAVKRSGLATARQAAKAEGFSDAAFDEMVAPKPKKRKPAEGDAAAAGDPSPGDPPAEADAPASPAGGRGEGGGWSPTRQPVKPLPEGCPVKPLGRSDGAFHYLDPLNQVATLTATDHSAMGLRALFGAQIAYLWAIWPKYSASTGNQDGFKADRAAESLMHACSMRGVFDAPRRVRGTGAWLSPAGTLVLHAGDGVLIGGEWRPPGEYDGFIYTAHEATIRPAEGDIDHKAAIGELLGKLDSWRWRREPGERDALGHRFASLLILGWIGSAIVGGALRWRPLVWLTGEAASGKSTLFAMLAAVLGDLLMVEDTTPAAVRTTLGQSTKPVLLDEAENNPNSRRAVGMIETARIAASGGTASRSSSDHKVSTTTLRSSFMFSSIIIPPMLGQDVSRFVVLDMDPIRGAGGLMIDVARMRRIGAILRRRVLDGWGRFEETLDAWRRTLVDLGHSSRGADTYGYPLAFVDLMLWDECADGDTRAEIAAMVNREAIEAKTSGSDGTAAMLQFLTSTAVDAFRGGTKFTVGTLVECVSGLYVASDGSAATPEACRDILRERGIFVERDGRVESDFGPGEQPESWRRQQWRVTLPNQHEGLRTIFAPSRWRTEPGATGGWVQALRRLPGVLAENSRKLGGRGWSVPAEVFLQAEEKT